MDKNVKIFASCHNHSTFSDADYTPERLVEIAHSLGHGGFILTDHDTVSGTYFVNKRARELGLKSILGCEFSTYHKGVGTHLLGFDFNPDNKRIKEILAYCSGIQTERSELLFKMGLESGSLREGITWQDVLDDNPYNTYICNNQIFRSYEKRGIYKHEEYEEFFRKNFRFGVHDESKIGAAIGKSYKEIHTEDVVKAIRDAGGVPIIAHPHGLHRFVDDFLGMGIKGFETRHPDLTDDECDFFAKVCEEKNLYQMGGSDHSGVLGGNLDFGEEYICPDHKSGITEESFMKIYERRLG